MQPAVDATTRGNETLALAVLEAVAEYSGTDPMDLEPPLADVIDPEALDRLFSRSDGTPDAEGYVVFRYGDYGVSVHADGRIAVFDAVKDPGLLR